VAVRPLWPLGSTSSMGFPISFLRGESENSFFAENFQ